MNTCNLLHASFNVIGILKFEHSEIITCLVCFQTFVSNMNATRSLDSHVGNSIGDFVLKAEIVPELDRTHALDVTWLILFFIRACSKQIIDRVDDMSGVCQRCHPIFESYL